MAEKKEHKTFINATKLRAKAYAYFYEESIKILSLSKAAEVCSRATYRMGKDRVKEFSKEAAESALVFAKEFAGDPAGSAVFKIKVLKGDKKTAVVEMSYCPLVEMWKELGYSSEKICTLCDIAHRIDFGTVEGMEYKLKFTERIACGGKKCILEIKKP